jgi:acetylglutamate kinase
MDVSVPVVATVATDLTGQAYNVNADLAASAIAVAVGAAKLLFVTDVAGVLREGELLSELTASDCRSLVAEGHADGGMLPKLEAAVAAVEGGVPRVHVVDGRVEHAVILELFTPEGAGTMIVAEREGSP